ncbi:hypothetical protein [Prosthecobacter sp.]|jgi:hypothetical protein|uniref:hypothetical protein n=1 Tax=Prosthecobacter sp. TaxID=1965333 RepID=UPI0037CC06CB
MSNPTRIKREHYQNLIGRQILANHWDKMEGKAPPILALCDRYLDGHAAPPQCLPNPEATLLATWITICDLNSRGPVGHFRAGLLMLPPHPFIPAFIAVPG